jgi:hypothetical protein
VPGGRVQPPFEDIAGEEERAGYHPVALSVALGTDVDEHGAFADPGGGFPRLEPVEPSACGVQEVVDRRAMSSHVPADYLTVSRPAATLIRRLS